MDITLATVWFKTKLKVTSFAKEQPLDEDFRPFTFDKHIGSIGIIARFGVDAQGVHALIFFVKVGKSEYGTFPRPVSVHPLRGL